MSVDLIKINKTLSVFLFEIDLEIETQHTQLFEKHCEFCISDICTSKNDILTTLLGKILPLILPYQHDKVCVSVLFSTHTTVNTNFAKGIRVQLNYTIMAHYFRNNMIYYASDEKSMSMYNTIFGRIYPILLKKLEKHVAYDYCETLFNVCITMSKSLNTVNNKMLTQENLNDDELHSIQELKKKFNKFVDLNTINDLNIEEIISDDYIRYINQMYVTLSFGNNESPNFIANKFLEHKMQYSLSVKHLKNGKKQKAPIDEDFEKMNNAGDNSDADEEYYDEGDDDELYDDEDDKDSAGNAAEPPQIHQTNFNLKNIFFFYKMLLDEESVEINLKDLPLHCVHYNISNSLKFVAFRLNVKQGFLQYLIDNYIIFAFRLLCDYVPENVLDVVVHVYYHTLGNFCTILKRYINRYKNSSYANLKILKDRSPIEHYDFDLIQEIGKNLPIKSISEAKKNVLHIVEMSMNSCLDGYRLSLKPKRGYDMIDVYIIIEKNALVKLMKCLSFSFMIRMKVAFKKMQYFYIHIYIHKNSLNELYKHLNDISNNERSTDEIMDIDDDPLEILWSQRPPVQMIYTSDYNSFIFEENRDYYLRNILFNVFIIKSGKYSPYPTNLADANLMCFLLLRIAKSVIFKQNSFFHVKNSIDGPLNNIVSIKGIASMVDSSINEKSFKCDCTTLCTMLNCPLYVGIQNPKLVNLVM